MAFTVKTWVDYPSTTTPLSAAAMQDLETRLSGYTDSSVQTAAVNGRGKANVATTESRTNAAYATLTTPDKVTGIVLPTDGLITVLYQATWSVSAGGGNTANAAIFLGANQLKVGRISGAPVTSAAYINGSAGDTPLSTARHGLINPPNGATSADVTTGQVVGVWDDVGAGGTTVELGGVNTTVEAEVALGNPKPILGGPCHIFAAAGTYDVSVQFKSSATVTAKNRKLWVWVQAFN